MRGGEVLCAETDHLTVLWGLIEKPASEDLPTGLAEVLRQECIEDGVDTGVSIRQAMGDDAKGKGGIIQGKDAKLHPHDNNVVGQPADSEGGDEKENYLSCLQDRGEKKSVHKKKWILSSTLSFMETL